MKVYAPNEKLTGISMGVHFENGVGECSDNGLLTWFRSHGYKVVDEEAEAARKAAAEKEAQEKAAAEKEAEEKAATEKEAQEKAAAEKEAAKKESGGKK